MAKLRPPPQITISIPTDSHRILGSRASSEPGRIAYALDEPIKRARSIRDSASMHATVIRTMITIIATSRQALIIMRSMRKKPIPPAPTTPRTVADRRLDSRK
jgi:hypothetical protein